MLCQRYVRHDLQNGMATVVSPHKPTRQYGNTESVILMKPPVHNKFILFRVAQLCRTLAVAEALNPNKKKNYAGVALYAYIFV